MTTEAKCLEYARECARRAKLVTNPELRDRLLTSLAVGLSAQPAKTSRATVSTSSQAAMPHTATFC